MAWISSILQAERPADGKTITLGAIKKSSKRYMYVATEQPPKEQSKDPLPTTSRAASAADCQASLRCPQSTCSLNSVSTIVFES